MLRMELEAELLSVRGWLDIVTATTTLFIYSAYYVQDRILSTFHCISSFNPLNNCLWKVLLFPFDQKGHL